MNHNIQAIDQDVIDFINMEDSIYKNHLYYTRFKDGGYREANLLYKDEFIYYGYSEYKVRRGTRYFLKRSSKKGFTFNTKTNKISIWFGSSISSIPYIHDAVKHICKNDWMDNLYWNYLTKTLLEKILAKKITNNEDLAKAILKMNRIKASPKYFNKAVVSANLTKDRMLQAARVAKDYDHFLTKYQEIMSGNDYHVVVDLERQAAILDRKIDYLWSMRRMKEEHTKWTKELMDMEAERIPDCTVESLKRFKNVFPKNWEILDTQKKVFAEGKMMSHCVYTNYWNSIQAERYMAIHITHRGEEATLGMRILTNGSLDFDQLYQQYNNRVSPEMKQHVDSVLLSAPIYVEQELPF